MCLPGVANQFSIWFSFISALSVVFCCRTWKRRRGSMRYRKITSHGNTGTCGGGWSSWVVCTPSGGPSRSVQCPPSRPSTLPGPSRSRPPPRLLPSPNQVLCTLRRDSRTSLDIKVCRKDQYLGCFFLFM